MVETVHLTLGCQVIIQSEFPLWIGYYQVNIGCEFEWTAGVGDGQGSLACCNSWGCKESDMTEWMDNNNYHVGRQFRNSCINISLKADKNGKNYEE